MGQYFSRSENEIWKYGHHRKDMGKWDLKSKSAKKMNELIIWSARVRGIKQQNVNFSNNASSSLQSLANYSNFQEIWMVLGLGLRGTRLNSSSVPGQNFPKLSSWIFGLYLWDTHLSFNSQVSRNFLQKRFPYFFPTVFSSFLVFLLPISCRAAGSSKRLHFKELGVDAGDLHVVWVWISIKLSIGSICISDLISYHI